MNTLKTSCCSSATDLSSDRVRYFPRQLLAADDMRTEQEYFREKQRRHNRFLHGWGVVCGLEVVKPGDNDPKWQVTVCPGYAISPQGDEILVTDKIQFDLQTKLQSPEPCAVRWSCPPEEGPPPDSEKKTIFLAIRYIECNSRPVRVHPAGCGCDEAACEYSRVRDSFELKVLWKRPDSHVQAKKVDEQWCLDWKRWVNIGEGFSKSLPRAPCYPCTDEPWLVLATITLPKDKSMAVDEIEYWDRRPLYSSTVLQLMHTCK